MVQLIQLALLAAAFFSSPTLSAVPAERLVERQEECSSVVEIYLYPSTTTIITVSAITIETSVATRTLTGFTLEPSTSTYTTILKTSSPTSYTTVLPTSVLSSYITNATRSTWVLSYYTTVTTLPTYVPTSITTVINTFEPANYTTVITGTETWGTSALETFYHTISVVSQTTLTFLEASTPRSTIRTSTCQIVSQPTS